MIVKFCRHCEFLSSLCIERMKPESIISGYTGSSYILLKNNLTTTTISSTLEQWIYEIKHINGIDYFYLNFTRYVA